MPPSLTIKIMVDIHIYISRYSYCEDSFMQDTSQNPAQSSSRKQSDVSRFRHFAQALMMAAGISVPLLALLSASTYATWKEMNDARKQAIADEQAYEVLVAGTAGSAISVDAAKLGREKFAATCAICHGPQGLGVDGLGRNLVTSDFVARSDDSTLHKFVVTGRPNAKPSPMPPKGGYDHLTDADISYIVAWVRCLQDPRRAPELPAMAAAVPAVVTEADKTAALEAAGGDAELAGYIASGNKLFHTTCIACHGKGGVGIQGNGAALANNAFIQSLDEDGLLDFISKGRSPSDPKNKTGIQMPPKGGNPALSEDDLLDIISYVRTLQPSAPKDTASK